jgi:hypothetical protein
MHIHIPTEQTFTGDRLGSVVKICLSNTDGDGIEKDAEDWTDSLSQV